MFTIVSAGKLIPILTKALQISSKPCSKIKVWPPTLSPSSYPVGLPSQIWPRSSSLLFLRHVLAAEGRGFPFAMALLEAARHLARAVLCVDSDRPPSAVNSVLVED